MKRNSIKTKKHTVLLLLLLPVLLWADLPAGQRQQSRNFAWLQFEEWGTASQRPNLIIKYSVGSAEGHYVLKVDPVSFPQNSILTTDNVETAVFTGSGEVDCANNFGLSTHLPPVANPDTAYVDAGTSVIINVIGNDYDPEGTPLTMTILTNPPNGAAVNNQNGSLTFTPNNGFTGWQTFQYKICDAGTPSLCDTTTVSVLVSPFVNNRPEAQDDYDTTYVNTPVETDLVFNDFDAEFDNLTVSLSPGILQPANGTLLIVSEHEIEYIPNPGFTGNDSYCYIVCDDRSPALCDTAGSLSTCGTTRLMPKTIWPQQR